MLAFRFRPSAEQVMIHPYFWNNTQRLAFLQDASDRFEIEERHPPSPLLQTLEANAAQVVGHDWYKRIDRVVVNDLGKFRKYAGNSIRDLLRALRNKVSIECTRWPFSLLYLMAQLTHPRLQLPRNIIIKI